MRYLLLVSTLFIHFVACSQIVSPPKWFTNSFNLNKLNKKYDLGKFLSPSFLQGDFNGDSYQDIAVLIVEKGTNKKGVLIMHHKVRNYYVLGAGTSFGNGSDNFTWADSWELYKERTFDETIFNGENGDIIKGKKIKVSHPAILIRNTVDGTGGLIYWNNGKYTWAQQGD